MKSSLTLSLPAGLVILLLAGCGSSEPMGKVTGKVTFKGTPVTEGTITFENVEQGGIAAGELQSDGTYSLYCPQGGLKPGDYKVAVTPPVVEGSSNGRTASSASPKETKDIPKKYRDGKTSGLVASVKDGKNQFDFDMN